VPPEPTGRGAGEPAPPGELVQPVPLVAVRGRICVDIHGRSLT